MPLYELLRKLEPSYKGTLKITIIEDKLHEKYSGNKSDKTNERGA